MTIKRIIKLLEYLSSVDMDTHYRWGTQSETDKALRLLRKMKEVAGERKTNKRKS